MQSPYKDVDEIQPTSRYSLDVEVTKDHSSLGSSDSGYLIGLGLLLLAIVALVLTAFVRF